MKFYAPLTKIEEQDDGSLRIEGIASSEVVDSAGEIVLASAMKAAVPGFMAYGTGALREMHGLSAAGTVDEVEVREDGNTYVKATVIDEQACRKLLKKVYKGLSIGGRVLARDPDNRKVITGIAWSELSLVDRPCCPTATIELVRADWTNGLSEEQIEGAEPDAPEADVEDQKNAAAQIEPTEESDESLNDFIDDFAKRDFDAAQRKKDAKNGTAMKDGSFPIQDKEDLKNAIRLAGRAKDPAAARAHIKRRAKALGAEDMIPDTWKDGAKKADVVENQMPAKKKATDTVEKAIEPAPINATQVADVMADGAGNGDATGINQPVAGKHTAEPSIPDGGPAVSTEVKNPEEAGQATTKPLGETAVAPVEHVAGETPKPGTDTRTRKEAAAEGEAVTSDEVPEESSVEKTEAADPIAAARQAAENALKAATAVMQSLAKRAGEVPEPLRAGLELRKGLPATGRLGCLLSELAYCLFDAQMEKAMEGDDSQVPEKLHAAVESLAAAYKAMSDEELQELLTSADNSMSAEIALAAAGGDLSKAFEGVVEEDALAKLAGDSTDGEALAKVQAQNADLLKTVGSLTDTLSALTAKVENLENQPLPAKTTQLPAGIQAVSKAEDTSAISAAAAPAATAAPTTEDVQKTLAAMSEEDRVKVLMKAALSPANGRRINR